MDFLMEYATWGWLAALVVLVLIEAFTVQLVSIWFAAGALGALITSILTDSLLIQLLVFILVTVIALVLSKPLMKRIKKVQPVATNADRYVGQTGIVTEPISNIREQGLVSVGGSIWSARNVKEEEIEANVKVKVEAIQGVKLIVSVID